MCTKLLIYVYADEQYYPFVVPYIYFALRNNQKARVEVKLKNKKKFMSEHGQAIEMLNKLYCGRFSLYQCGFNYNEKVIPNTIRFIEPATDIAEYLYIGDIDLLVFEDICDIHIPRLIDEVRPFSNIVRDCSANKPRLTGLHFCKYDDFYPLPDISDFDLSVENDEYILYELVKRKGLNIDYDYKYRPECGIHMSLNRDPVGRYVNTKSRYSAESSSLSWGGQYYYTKLLDQIQDQDFMLLYPYLSIEFRFLLLNLEAIAKDKFYSLHWLAVSYTVDKRLIFNESKFDLTKFNSRRDYLINNGDLDGALSLSAKACFLWPKNLDVLKKFLYLLISTSNYVLATLIVVRILDLDRSNKMISDLNFVKSSLDKLQSEGGLPEESYNLILSLY